MNERNFEVIQGGLSERPGLELVHSLESVKEDPAYPHINDLVEANLHMGYGSVLSFLYGKLDDGGLCIKDVIAEEVSERFKNAHYFKDNGSSIATDFEINNPSSLSAQLIEARNRDVLNLHASLYAPFQRVFKDADEKEVVKLLTIWEMGRFVGRIAHDAYIKSEGELTGFDYVMHHQATIEQSTSFYQKLIKKLDGAGIEIDSWMIDKFANGNIQFDDHRRYLDEVLPEQVATNFANKFLTAETASMDARLNLTNRRKISITRELSKKLLAPLMNAEEITNLSDAQQDDYAYSLPEWGVTDPLSKQDYYKYYSRMLVEPDYMSE